MKIAVDLDDTLSVVDRVTRPSGYIARMGLPFKLVDRYSHSLEKTFDWTLPDVLEFVHAGGVTVFTEAEARKGVRETLSALRAAGHSVTVLTARTKEWFEGPEQVSRDWLEKRKIPYDEVVAECRDIDKGAYCIEHGIKVLVDDSLETCLRAQELGVQAVLAVGRHNAARAHEVKYGGADWRQIGAILFSLTEREEGEGKA